jgi:hypothetical protein
LYCSGERLFAGAAGIGMLRENLRRIGARWVGANMLALPGVAVEQIEELTVYLSLLRQTFDARRLSYGPKYTIVPAQSDDPLM